jgi:hypothetical protein
LTGFILPVEWRFVDKRRIQTGKTIIWWLSSATYPAATSEHYAPI